MRILNKQDIAISGFAGVRERVLVQDRHYFSHHVADACWDGFGPLVYFADAWFNPRRSTGLHHHNQVDIISLLPHGSMLHEGTIGHGETLHAGQAQIQRSGQQGFSHNEINPHHQAQPFLQLWLTPTEQALPSYHLVELADNATTVVEQRPGFSLAVGRWHSPQEWHTTQPALLYLFRGEGVVSDAEGNTQALGAGSMVQAPGLTFSAQAAQFFVAYSTT